MPTESVSRAEARDVRAWPTKRDLMETDPMKAASAVSDQGKPL